PRMTLERGGPNGLSRGDAAGGLAQLVPGQQFEPRAAERRAAARLRYVDRLPTGVGDVLHAPLGEQLLDRLRGRRGIPARELPRPRVLEHEVDRLGRVLLVGPDHAAGPAFDPACAVDAGCVGDPTAVVRDGRPAIVERDARKCDPEVADAP